MHSNRQTPRAFTLIELLVVIAIIALLIGILLPALGSARASAVELACRVRMRELSMANFYYATDNRDRTMPTVPILIGRDQYGFASITKNWAYTFERGDRIDEGYLIEYVDNAVEIVACPLNQRQDPGGIAEDPDNPDDIDLYPGGEINFDFSFVDYTEGAETFASFDVQMAVTNDGGGAPGDAAELQPFPGLPMIVEESSVWYNNNSPRGVSDGRWGNWDQWTTRHGGGSADDRRGGGMTAYLDGRVERFDPPQTFDNENPNHGSGAEGFNSHDIYLIDRAGEPNRLYNINLPYGGINEFRR